MRDILFRGKDKDDGKWYEGAYRAYDDTTYCIKEDYDRHPENTHHTIVFSRMTDWGLPNRHLQAEVIPETVGQYTGLQDKNGKKIFEGDICTEGENIYEVIFDKYQFSVKVIKTPLYLIKKGDIFPLWQFDNCERNGYRQLEIIGNIYDNPELLEGK